MRFRDLTPEEVEEQRRQLLDDIAQAESDPELSPEERASAAYGWQCILDDLEAGELQMVEPDE